MLSLNSQYNYDQDLSRFKKNQIIDANTAWQAYFNNIKWIESLGHKIIIIGNLPKPLLKSKHWLLANKKYIQNLNFPNIYNDAKPSKIL